MAAPPRISLVELRRLYALAAEAGSDCEHVRAVVCRDGERVAEFEYANEAHEYVRRRHDADSYRLVNPETVAA